MFGGRRGTTEIVRVGAYELRVQVLHAGTRSEGRVGRLYLDGVEITGGRPGETIVVEPEGTRFVHLGDERPHLWSVSGWAVDPAEED